MKYWPIFLETIRRFSFSLFYLYSKKVQIIQIGANDGVACDTLNTIVKKSKSHSILIEPVQYVYEKLVTNYNAYPQVRTWRIAITPNVGENARDLFFLEPHDGSILLENYSLWSSFDLDHIKKYKQYVPDFDDILRVESIPCITINKLFNECGFDSLQILQIDIEGLDAAVVSSMDFKIVKPEIIIFEHYHCDSIELRELLIHLSHSGYVTYSFLFDTVCVRNDKLAPFFLLSLIKMLRPGLLIPHRVVY